MTNLARVGVQLNPSRSFLILPSIIYSVGQIGLGLLLHPYQTMQQLIEDKVFVGMSLLPMVVLALMTVGWRFGLVPLVRVVFSCASSGFVLCNYISFVSDWLTFFIIYWQLLLLYLLFRFWWVFGEKN